MIHVNIIEIATAKPGLLLYKHSSYKIHGCRQVSCIRETAESAFVKCWRHSESYTWRE